MKKHNLAHLLALSVTLAAAGPASAQDADPFVKKSVSNTLTGKVAASHSSEIEQLNPDLPRNIMVTYEAFSVPIEEAPKLCRGGFTHKSLYTALTTDGEKHSTTLENYTSLVCLPGQLATSQAISEFIYPTEFEPANDYRVGTETAVAPSLPTSFDTKNLGITLECECAISAGPSFVALTKKGSDLLRARLSNKPANHNDPFASPAPPKKEDITQITEALSKGDIKSVTYIEMRISPSQVEKVAEQSWGQGVSEVVVPNFDAETVKTGFTLVSGEPSLIGTINPHPKSAKHNNGNRVWFAFITATVMPAGL